MTDRDDYIQEAQEQRDERLKAAGIAFRCEKCGYTHRPAEGDVPEVGPCKECGKDLCGDCVESHQCLCHDCGEPVTVPDDLVTRATGDWTIPDRIQITETVPLCKLCWWKDR